MLPVEDGGYIMTGTVSLSPGEKGFAIGTDRDGSLSWSHIYEGSFGAYVRIHAMDYAYDGYVLAGSIHVLSPTDHMD
jgi:hypothetical protein